ncbi:MAG: GNAT family N-acetyltransferase [Marinifilaceae bacterium]|jgi:hypothetical protein|nr:GNAT family N-acetyltransferase [Marinifilaceae bacterium]
MNLKEKNLSNSSIDDLQFFLSKFWKKDHPLVKSRELLEWQFLGFGKNRGYDYFQMFYDGDELIAIRGVIPQEVQIPTSEYGYMIEPMGACAMWMVLPEYRNVGKVAIGFKIHKNIEDQFNVLMSIGANINTSARIYRRKNYFENPDINRYIIPLSNEYKNLLIDFQDDNQLIDWQAKIQLEATMDNDFVDNLNSQEMGNIWKNFVKKNNIFSLNRTKEFWEWRYFKSPCFKYNIFGGEKYGGFIVARIEEAVKEDNNKIKLLRIIEMVPFNSEVWNGVKSILFEELLKNVLIWARKNNCVAADFHITTNRFEALLSNVGFVKQNVNKKTGLYSMVGLFQPIVYDTYSYNCFIRISDKFKQYKEKFNYNDSYIVRSDSDQDRPNIL